MKTSSITASALAIILASTASTTLGGEPENASKPHLLRASTVIGMNVDNSAGEKLADIHDLALGARDGRCRFAILSHGGVGTIGDTLTPVPLKALKFDANGKAVQINLTKERFDQAPRLEDKDWNTIGEPRWGTTVYEFYTIKPDFEVEKESGTVTRQQHPIFIKGSKAVGMDVHNTKDEDLGEIEDLMLDVNSGRVAYAVLSFGGVLGVNEKLFAVPWQALAHNAEKNMFVLNVEKEKLKSAPGFDENRWPDMADLNWSKDVHAFYGSDPNWIYGYSGASGAASAGGWGMNDQYGRMFKKDGIQTVKGSITDVTNVTPMSGMDQGTQIAVQTDRELVNVHLGPQWFIEKLDRQLAKGDQVEVSGCRVEIDGKPVLIATEIKRGESTLRLRDKNGRACWAAWHDENDD